MIPANIPPSMPGYIDMCIDDLVERNKEDIDRERLLNIAISLRIVDYKSFKELKMEERVFDWLLQDVTRKASQPVQGEFYNAAAMAFKMRILFPSKADILSNDDVIWQNTENRFHHAKKGTSIGKPFDGDDYLFYASVIRTVFPQHYRQAYADLPRWEKARERFSGSGEVTLLHRLASAASAKILFSDNVEITERGIAFPEPFSENIVNSFPVRRRF